jgi:hypothetical protein
MRAARVDRIIRDVTFLFEDPCNFGFDLRVRNEHLQLLRTRAVADARRKSAIGSVTVLIKNQAACAAGFFARSLNGMPISLNSDLASSSVRAVVTL